MDYETMTDAELNAEVAKRLTGHAYFHGEAMVNFCRKPLAVRLLADEAFDRGDEFEADCRPIVLAWLRLEDARREGK